jgi:WD40 repeat protein
MKIITSLILDGHAGRVNVVQYNNKENEYKRIASGGNDGTIRIWNPITGACDRIINAHDAPVTTLSWSPYGTVDIRNEIIPSMKIVSGSEDRTVKVWNVMTGKEEASFNIGSVVRSVSWRPLGDLVACGDAEGRLTLWQISSGSFSQRPVDNKRSVNAVQWTADSKSVIFGSDDGKIYQYSVAEKKIKILKDLISPIRTVACSGAGGGNFIVAASINEEGNNLLISGSNPINIRNVSTCVDIIPNQQSTYPGNISYPVERGVLSVSCHTGGDYFAAGCEDGTVRIFELSDAPVMTRPFVLQREPIRTRGERETEADLRSAILDVITKDTDIRNNIIQILQNDVRFKPPGDTPDTDAIKKEIERKIMEKITEYLDFNTTAIKKEIDNVLEKKMVEMNNKITRQSNEESKTIRNMINKMQTELDNFVNNNVDVDIQTFKNELEKLEKKMTEMNNKITGQSDEESKTIKDMINKMQTELENFVNVRDVATADKIKKMQTELENFVNDKVDVDIQTFKNELEKKMAEMNNKITGQSDEVDESLSESKIDEDAIRKIIKNILEEISNTSFNRKYLRGINDKQVTDPKERDKINEEILGFLKNLLKPSPGEQIVEPKRKQRALKGGGDGEPKNDGMDLSSDKEEDLLVDIGSLFRSVRLRF